MADDVRVTNLPLPGSSQAVALELWKVLRGYLEDGSIQKELDLFAQCHNAATFRSYDVKNLG